MDTKITLMLLSLLSCSACKTNDSNSSNTSKLDSTTVNSVITEPFEIDLTKKYPVKRISLQEIADIEYIQLERRENVIADRIRYISDSLIIAIEYKRGDIITFSGDGKFISKFNKKGRSGEEYQSIGHIAYSPEERELFITDYMLLHRIQVYSIDGLYKRTLNHPGSWITSIYNFDSETLLAYEDPDFNTRKQNNEIFTPYLFLSKEDGSIISKANISFKKEDRVSASKVIVIDKYRSFQATISQTNIIKSNNDNYIIGDLSLDTIFMVKNDKSITPIIIKKSKNDSDSNLLSFLVYKNDKYSFFAISDFNLDSLRKNNNLKIDSKYLLYWASDGQVNEIKLYNEDYPEYEIDINGIGRVSQKGYASYSIEAYKLVDAFKNDNLKGELKEIASKLTDDDNRVLVKFIFK
ncbi:MAG: 6-bladed beta-propeller [Bacteroidales bacterium]|nr:6-bladed beta-propeller [Bacteroidales bacterium]